MIDREATTRYRWPPGFMVAAAGSNVPRRSFVARCSSPHAALLLVLLLLAGCTTTAAPATPAMPASPPGTAQQAVSSSPVASPFSSPLAVGGGSLPEPGPALLPAAADPCLRPPAVGSTRLAGGDAPFLVVVASLNLRAGPGTDCPVLGSLPFGTIVTPSGETVQRAGRVWHRLRTPQGNGFSVADGIQPLPAHPPRVVPVLLYHRLGDQAGELTVTRSAFTAQLDWLDNHGFVAITPTDLANYLDEGQPLPARPVLITIDDYWAPAPPFPEVVAAGGVRAAHVLPNGADLDATEIAALAASGEVCAHTITHPYLDQLPAAAQWTEIAGNKTWLEGIIGRPVTCFAYPFGFFDPTTVELVQAAGFRLAFDAHGGIAHLDGGFDRWHVPRTEVSGTWTLAEFAAVIEAATGASDAAFPLPPAPETP
jgi:peptidoglycan/xylan/chitin deacetylase (PgdA/CDA1 family)